jgi:hypothetical protein
VPHDPEAYFPDHWSIDSRNPPPQPVVDPDRIGHLVIGFIADKQAALYDAADAFYRKSGVWVNSSFPTRQPAFAKLTSAQEMLGRHELGETPWISTRPTPRWSSSTRRTTC